MKPQTKTELSQLLSGYLDGELDERQIHDVETILSQDSEARKEFEELRALKSLLTSKRQLPPSYGFWSRFSTELERRKREEDNLLPFPRKYVPAVAISGAIVVLVLGVLMFQQRSRLIEYVSRQSERVQKAVEDNVLKGSLMPLFTHIDKNQALQFAMFGTLPLDAKAETEMRVNEDSARGYTIDVDKKRERKTPTVTVQDFVDEVQPSHVQLQIIDSLLDLGRVKLEGSILVAEDKAMAVNPELSRLNRVMLSGIAAALEPDQRVKFEQFLHSRKSTYMLAGGRRGPESAERIYHTMRTPEGMAQFVVFSPDTVLVSRLEIDLDSLRRHTGAMVERQRTVGVHVNSLIRRMAEREMAVSMQQRPPAPHVRISGDSDSFSIQVSTGWEGMPAMPRDPWVRPRMSEQVGRHGQQPGAGFNMQLGGDDSSFFFNLDMDSIAVRIGKSVNGGGFEVFKGDPRSRGRAVQGKERKMSKLDSLMNEMDKRERQRERLQKEKQLPEPRR
ncbi:MAG: hypothetical protein NTU47_07280 [Ignavibacteriales bacterium]|nr:hypothetical protein [Ignavibacteriales bacterium]